MEISPDKTGKILSPSWRSFIVYYIMIGICFLGPHLNPQFSAQIWLTPDRGLLIGIILLLAVGYLKLGQEYHITSEGVKKLNRFPARQESLTWAEVDQIEVRRGLTQTLFQIGNIVIKPGNPARKPIVFLGIESPKQVKDLMERWRS